MCSEQLRGTVIAVMSRRDGFPLMTLITAAVCVQRSQYTLQTHSFVETPLLKNGCAFSFLDHLIQSGLSTDTGREK